jgi:Probable zinc-ribbon domain
MKSGRQRRDEIRLRRRARSERPHRYITPPWQVDRIPRGAVAADLEKLWHDNTYGRRPLYYLDVSFSCIDCGKSEIWTAAQQKWWYEEAKGLIASRANRCRECRRTRRMRRSQDRRVHIEGLVAKYGLEATASRLAMPLEVLMRLREQWESA